MSSLANIHPNLGVIIINNMLLCNVTMEAPTWHRHSQPLYYGLWSTKTATLFWPSNILLVAVKSRNSLSFEE